MYQILRVFVCKFFERVKAVPTLLGTILKCLKAFKVALHGAPHYDKRRPPPVRCENCKPFLINFYLNSATSISLLDIINFVNDCETRLSGSASPVGEH